MMYSFEPTGRRAFERRFIELADAQKHIDWDRLSYGKNRFAFRLSNHLRNMHAQYEYSGGFVGSLREPADAAQYEFNKLLRMLRNAIKDM